MSINNLVIKKQNIAEELFYRLERLPDFLFVIIQSLLFTRFMLYLLSADHTNPGIAFIFQLTTVLSLPISILISPQIPANTLIHEVLLTTATIPYALFYMLITALLQKIFLRDEE
jgi:hypothetical protein